MNRFHPFYPIKMTFFYFFWYKSRLDFGSNNPFKAKVTLLTLGNRIFESKNVYPKKMDAQHCALLEALKFLKEHEHELDTFKNENVEQPGMKIY